MILRPTSPSPTYNWCFVVLSLWLGMGLFSTGISQEVSTNQPLQVLTNTSQFARLTGEEARYGTPVLLQGQVVSIDRSTGEALIKDATGTVPVKVDLTKYPLFTGQTVLLDGKTGASIIRYPDFPSGRHYLTSFEAPQNVGNHYAARMRGYLHPPQTGEYTFWIASDDGSELWMSPDANEKHAKKIASAEIYSLSREWDKYSSQRSGKIRLTNNQTYYIEAIHNEIFFGDCLAVAWEGPGISRNVIEGRYLSPWSEAPQSGGAKMVPSVPSGSILREFWLGYPFQTYPNLGLGILNWVNFGAPYIVVSGLQNAPGQTPDPPRHLSPQQPLKPEEDYQWCETEGIIVETASDGQESILVLSDQKRRMSLHLAASSPDKILGLVNARIRVRGFCQGAFDPRGERVAAILWVPSLEDICLMEPQEQDWLRLPALPLHQVTDTNSPTSEGQRVRLLGRAVMQNQGTNLMLRGVSQFSAFLSRDGTNWTQVGEPIPLPMNQSIYAGLSVESYDPIVYCTAIMDRVVGLTGPWTNTDVGNPPLRGTFSLYGDTFKVRGTGAQSRETANTEDQFHFIYQSMTGDGELVARVLSVEGQDWDNAGITMRETLNRDSKGVTLAVPVGKNAFVLRLRRGTSNPNENIFSTGLFTPSWLKLTRKSSCLVVHSEQKLPVAPDQFVEAMGVLERTNDTWVLNQAYYRLSDSELASPATAPSNFEQSKLTTALQIRQLSAEELLKNRTATLRGTVTAKEDDLYVQDGTAGIRLPSLYSQNFSQCKAGQYVEVSGLCMPGNYSPVLVPDENGHVTLLGVGQMPEADLKSWEQLMSGKEEAQWVEVRGVVRSVEGRNLKLQMPGGIVSCLLGFDYSADYLPRLVDATVSLQGVCKVLANEKRQLVGVQLLLPTAEQVTIAEPALEDPFGRQPHLSSELLKFDSQKELFHRVKVEGVVTCQRGGTLFLQDVTGGMTVAGRGNENLRRGDRVEAVGFVESGGFSPVLTEALVRKVGEAKLPTPLLLPMDKLLQGQNDAQRVRLEAVLLAQKIEDGNQVLEFLSERRSFRSLLATNQGIVASVPSGSRVALVGVFKTEPGGLSQTGERVSSFQVLLDSPEDVVILERPPWWSWKHTLAALGILLIGLCGIAAWIRTLRRVVEERTRELAKEMQLREASEQQRLLEGERSRIARDLHDSLGATLTQIRFISIRGSRAVEIPDRSRTQMVRISEKSLEMVSTLDEIVWAVNPANDSLKNLVTYLCHMAEEFFSSTSIRCRLDVDEKIPSAPLTAEVRHNIYLAVREVFNNIAKHSHATEVWLHIHEHDGGILFAIEDNGCGLVLLERTNRSGLTNIRTRLEKINGKVEFETQTDSGTVCRLWLPLAPSAGGATPTPGA